MSENGILAKVPGDYVSMGSKDLPHPSIAEDGEYDAVIDAGHAGRVRIFYKRTVAKRGKHSHSFWLAVRAESVAI